MHQHHDHHDHHHHHGDDEHAHRNLGPVEEPLDAANQSLADALRASFGILKVIMAILFVLYLASNVRRVESHEQALRLHFGALEPRVYEGGLVWAFPFPVDEIVPLPTRSSNELTIDSHTFNRTEAEKTRPLAMISRSDREGLKPGLDGALLTADSGLVHVRWKVTYKIDDLIKFVTNLQGREVDAAEKLITATVESAGIELAAETTAEEMIRTRVDHVQSEMRRRVNQRLTAIGSGIEVTRVEMFEPTPPIAVRPTFDGTQRAENSKRSRIRDAEQQRTNILSEAAGSGYQKILDALEAIEKGGTPERSADEWRKELRLLLTSAEGEAGQMIKDAGAFLSTEVGRIQSDVELYRTLLPEYERNPQLLIARLWEQAKNEIMKSGGVTKFYRPGSAQIRLQIPLDPEQTKLEEAKRLQTSEFDAKKLTPQKLVPIGPDKDH